MEGFFRRGGVWYARLVVPLRLRHLFGKTELVASTFLRDPDSARVVAGERLADWRRELYEVERLASRPMTIDFERLSIPHPTLSRGGYLPLVEAAHVSGFDMETLLREAADQRIGLFYRASGVVGYQIALADLIAKYKFAGGGIEVPLRCPRLS